MVSPNLSPNFLPLFPNFSDRLSDHSVHYYWSFGFRYLCLNIRPRRWQTLHNAGDRREPADRAPDYKTVLEDGELSCKMLCECVRPLRGRQWTCRIQVRRFRSLRSLHQRLCRVCHLRGHLLNDKSETWVIAFDAIFIDNLNAVHSFNIEFWQWQDKPIPWSALPPSRRCGDSRHLRRHHPARPLHLLYGNCPHIRLVWTEHTNRGYYKQIDANI